MPKGKPTGIRTRHRQDCGTRESGGCNCEPAYEASVYSKRDGKKIRKTFASAAEAKREMAVIGTAHPDHRGTLFVMIGPSIPQTEET